MELTFGSITLLLITDDGDLKEKINQVFHDQIVFSLSPKSRFFKRVEKLSRIYRHINVIIVDLMDEERNSDHLKQITDICDHFLKSHIIGILPDHMDSISPDINHKRFYPANEAGIVHDLREMVTLITQP